MESISVSATLRTTALVVVVLLVAYILRDIVQALGFLFFLVVISIFFAYLLEPLVKLIRRPFVVRNLDKLMPRPLAIVISYLIVFTGLGIAISYLAPLIATQVGQFVQDLPNYASTLQDRLDSLNNSFEELMITPELQVQINTTISTFVGDITKTLSGLLFGVYGVWLLTYVPWLLVIPVLAFFFLKDARMFRSMFLGCFPPGRWRARTESVLNDVNTTIAAYTRAQLISCLLIGALCTLGFTLIGLDYPLLLGVLAGFLEFIPLLGPFAIGTTAVLIGAFSDNPWEAVWTALFLILLRITHDYVTYPRIVRNGVHLHPFAVILSILAGHQIAGIAGVFLSIPVVALITVFHKHILEHSGTKGLFAEIFRSRDIDAPEATPQTD